MCNEFMLLLRKEFLQRTHHYPVASPDLADGFLDAILHKFSVHMARHSPGTVLPQLRLCPQSIIQRSPGFDDLSGVGLDLLGVEALQG